MTDWKSQALKLLPEARSIIEASTSFREFLDLFTNASRLDAVPPDREEFNQRFVRFCNMSIRGSGMTADKFTDLFAIKAACDHLQFLLPQDNRTPAERADALLNPLLHQSGAREAGSWLKSGKGLYSLGELTPAGSVRLINTIYRAGAVTVTAVEIRVYPDGSENTGKLVLTLPDDPLQRTAVFDWEAKQARKRGFCPAKDVGQHYLFAMLD
jgi:hypothetical protein